MTIQRPRGCASVSIRKRPGSFSYRNEVSGGSRLTVKESLIVDRNQVLFPVPRGPKRKKDDRGSWRSRGNIGTKFTAYLVSSHAPGKADHAELDATALTLDI